MDRMVMKIFLFMHGGTWREQCAVVFALIKASECMRGGLHRPPPHPHYIMQRRQCIVLQIPFFFFLFIDIYRSIFIHNIFYRFTRDTVKHRNQTRLTFDIVREMVN
jgi:hypothetical protein